MVPPAPHPLRTEPSGFYVVTTGRKSVAHYFVAGSRGSLCGVKVSQALEPWLPNRYKAGKHTRATSPVCKACRKLHVAQWTEQQAVAGA
jgi:hypothetical protein